MQRFLKLTALSGLFLIILAVIVLPVFAEPVVEKELNANNDNVMDTLIARTGTYDPCCNGLTWLDEFTRSSVIIDPPANNYWLRFRYAGVSPVVYHQYYSSHYEPNTSHSFTGSLEINPSTSHEIILSKSTALQWGAWISMHAKATYWNPNQDSPQGP